MIAYFENKIPAAKVGFVVMEKRQWFLNTQNSKVARKAESPSY